MRSLLPILALIFLNIHSYAAEKQFEGMVFVGGQARPTTYTVNSSKETIFSREKYSMKIGKVVGISSPNTLRVETSSRTEDVILIGLMDPSSEYNQPLRARLVEALGQKFLNRKVKIYNPREYQDWSLLPNHGFIISDNRLAQAEILEEGLGFSGHSKMFESEIMEEFEHLMREASRSGKGVFAGR